jgi:hypothetical protein
VENGFELAGLAVGETFAEGLHDIGGNDFDEDLDGAIAAEAEAGVEGEELGFAGAEDFA